MIKDEYSSDLIGQREMRLDKLRILKEKGIDPFPSKSFRTKKTKDIIDNFENLNNLNSREIVAGRIKSIRTYGKLIFLDLHDYFGKIQIIVRANNYLLNVNQFSSKLKLENLKFIEFVDLNLLDVGDFVEVGGMVTKSNTGEISIDADYIRILTKSIRPIPDELEDVEERFRRRYVDMNVHPEIRKRFERRSIFWQATREFLNKNEFIEINIPVLEHTTGGADAKPFVTHYDSLDQDFYLRISHELPLKRLLGAGFEKVYDIGPRFRNEGFSDEHLPEHIAMEWYWAYADYKDGMELTQNLFRYVLNEVYGKLEFELRGFKVNLESEWEEIDFVEIIKSKFNVDPLKDSEEKLLRVLADSQKSLDIEVESLNRPRIIDMLWKLIRKEIIGPAFLVNIPKALSPLAKSNIDRPDLVDRFHPIIAGTEMGNAFSELNDPIDQLERFLEQQRMRDAGDEEAQMLDIDFVEMLEYGMPPAVGYGHSERVFWIFEGVSAKEGVPFPHLKREITDLTKQIYSNIKF